MTKLSKEQLEEALGEENGAETKREENTPLSHSTKSRRYFSTLKTFKKTRLIFFLKSLLKKKKKKEDKRKQNREGEKIASFCVTVGKGAALFGQKKLYGTESLDNQLSAGDICEG